MNIIFLDIDGVLNNFSRNDYHRYSSYNLKNLKIILDSVPNTKIILSTYHRNSQISLKILKLMLEKYDMDFNKLVIGKTKQIQENKNYYTQNDRSNEIMDCVNQHKQGIRKWVALDDLELNLPLRNFINTDPEYGLTEQDAKKAIYNLL